MVLCVYLCVWLADHEVQCAVCMSHSLSSDSFPVTAAEEGQSSQQQQEEEGDNDAQDQTKNMGLIIVPSCSIYHTWFIMNIPVWDKETSSLLLFWLHK